MIDKNAPVGVFDSGVGGLTVAREIMRQLPDERIIYFGDTARVPYGSKSRDTVLRYSRQIIRFLRTKEVKAIVIACNTATALTLDTVAAPGPPWMQHATGGSVSLEQKQRSAVVFTRK